jgi:putative transposase
MPVGMKILSPNNKVRLYVHLIWCVKNRAPLLSNKTRIQLFDHIRQMAEHKKIKILILNGVEDHLHCLVQMHPLQQLSGLVKQLKGESSRWINENKIVQGGFRWQDGYAAYSVSPFLVKRVMTYIYNQEQHHQRQTFSEELELLEK